MFAFWVFLIKKCYMPIEDKSLEQNLFNLRDFKSQNLIHNKKEVENHPKNNESIERKDQLNDSKTNKFKYWSSPNEENKVKDEMKDLIESINPDKRSAVDFENIDNNRKTSYNFVSIDAIQNQQLISNNNLSEKKEGSIFKISLFLIRKGKEEKMYQYEIYS